MVDSKNEERSPPAGKARFAKVFPVLAEDYGRAIRVIAADASSS